MKKTTFIRFSFLLFIPLFCVLSVLTQEQSIDGFISQLQQSLDLENREAYLRNFSAEIRRREESSINSKYDAFQIETVKLFKASKINRTESQAEFYLQALFENSYLSIIETWHLSLLNVNGQWKIKEKKVLGNVSSLYKILIPSQRIERVKSIEIEHVDIKITFKDAILFYDNIPGREIALLILGNGHLRFSPSDPQEKHQLELIYKKSFLEDKLKYAFLRFSNHFFQNNIKIERQPKEKEPKITQVDLNMAYSLFTRHYSRSFTIENSLNGELLSFSPQGDEVVFEYEGRKKGIFTYVYSPFTKEEISLYQWKGNKIINRYSPRHTDNKKRFFLSFGQKFDVKSYQIDISFNSRQSYISGKAKIEVESHVGFLNSLKFRFNPGLEILRIQDEESRELFYSQDKLRKILYIYFIDSLPENKSYSVEIFYRGKLIPQEQVADVVRGPQYSEKLIFLPKKYETYLFSQSSFWYPAPSDDDYFQAQLKIIVPPGYACVSNGKLMKLTRLNEIDRVEEIDKVGSSVYVFKTEKPLKYLSFIVGKLSKVNEILEPLPLRLYHASVFFPEKRKIFEEAINIIRFYENRFGPFPYEKLTIVRRLWTTSGGHSPASFIVINELPRSQIAKRPVQVNSPVDLSRWKGYFLAHEIAHQWWGQGVTWKTYHDQWLSEGLAQYATILYLREKYGEREFLRILKKFSDWTEKKSDRGAITLGSRLSYFDFEAYQSIIYNKSSLVLNMLSEILGEDLFFKGLREFFNRHKYSAASTWDFMHTIEEVSGKDLTAFFRKWFDTYLLPEVRVSHSLLTKGNQYNLKLTISQPDDFFIFPLRIEWDENGNEVVKKLIIDSQYKEYQFELQEKPKKIRVNQDKAIPGKFKINS